MKHLLPLLALLCGLAFAGADGTIGTLPGGPTDGSGASASAGAENGCYTGQGSRVRMSTKGLTTGDAEVKLHDADSGEDGSTTNAGQHPDGGAWNSDEIDVGDDTFRVRQGELQKKSTDKNGDAHWKPLKKGDDDDCREEDETKKQAYVPDSDQEWMDPNSGLDPIPRAA